MPIYDYRCRTCGAETELDRLPAEGADMRHMVPVKGHEGVLSKVCGTFRRVYSTVNFNKVPGGARD